MKYSNMKSMKDLVSNINMTEHKEKEIVVDDFAKNVINKVFKELALILPAWQYAWKSDDPQNPDKVLNAAKQQWTKAFIENNINTVEQISHGFAKARKYESDFVPSCGKFISWCTPSPEDLGFPSEQKALEQCVTHRNKEKMHIDSDASHFIRTLCKCVDWWLMNTANGQNQVAVAKKLFREEYLHLIDTYQTPVETDSVRLETSEVTRKRLSPSQLESGRQRGLEHLAEIRKKLKTKV
tara:strand:- start:2866 stop:3582 length:717 start_codon:yes stop_codon:yes gene_type:complete